MSDYRLDLDWWLDLLNTYTTQPVNSSNYSVVANWNSAIHYTLLSLMCLQKSLPGSGFQRRTFPLLWVSELSSYLSYQLLTANVEPRRLTTYGPPRPVTGIASHFLSHLMEEIQLFSICTVNKFHISLYISVRNSEALLELLITLRILHPLRTFPPPK
jgi:hypothetical protein